MQINKASNKYDKIVAVSLTHDSLLEVALFDAGSKTVLKYDNTIVNYDKEGRKIESFEMFEETLKEMFLHMDIVPGSPVVVSLPDIFISQRIYSERISTIALEGEIKQELINTKLFDDVNPVARWKQLSVDKDEDTQLVLYSGMKEDIINFLKRSIVGLGMELVAIDNNYFSLIKGVIASELVTEDELGFDSWAILSLTQDQYQMISLTGTSIMAITQEPIAYDGTIGVYNKITDVILPTIESLWMSNLIIVNTVPGISSKQLADRLALDCQVNCVDINENATKCLYKFDEEAVDQDKSHGISPYVIGAASYQNHLEFGFDFAFDNIKFTMQSSNLFDIFASFNGKKARSTLVLLVIVVGALLAGLFILIFSFNSINENKKNKLLADRDDLNMQLQAQKPVEEFDLSKKANEFFEKDKDLSKSLILISDSIPDNLWVKEFSVYPDMSVYIRGYSYNVSDIVEFYKALRTFSKFKDLKITAILLAGDGKDSTNSGAAADKKDEKNPDGTPVDPSKPEDPSAATPPAAAPSADPNAKDGSDPSGLPALPELADMGALGSKPKVSAGADDIPTEKCYEFIIGKKI